MYIITSEKTNTYFSILIDWSYTELLSDNMFMLDKFYLKKRFLNKILIL